MNNKAVAEYTRELRALVPKADDAQYERILWQETPYPFAPYPTVRHELEAFIQFGQYNPDTGNRVPWPDGKCPFV